MSKAKNKVIAGDYKGGDVSAMFGSARIFKRYPEKGDIEINKTNVINYEVITDEHRKSAKSGVARGLVGGALLGPVGMLAGGISGKSKGIYEIAIEFRDGKRSLIEVDDKCYKTIIKCLF